MNSVGIEKPCGRIAPVTGSDHFFDGPMRSGSPSMHAGIFRLGLGPNNILRRVGVQAFNALCTEETVAAEAPFPARAACWGAVVIRETASRPTKAIGTKNRIARCVNKKARETFVGYLAGFSNLRPEL